MLKLHRNQVTTYKATYFTRRRQHTRRESEKPERQRTEAAKGDFVCERGENEARVPGSATPAPYPRPEQRPQSDLIPRKVRPQPRPIPCGTSRIPRKAGEASVKARNHREQERGESAGETNERVRDEPKFHPTNRGTKQPRATPGKQCPRGTRRGVSER